MAAALRDALLPGALPTASAQAVTTLPKLGVAAAANAPAASGLQPGAQVGAYQLIRLLGAGGMAEVWLARRADGALKREIALKLPMRHRGQAGLEARFARERDILASLEHPHIARLYDAGVDPEGLPFLAMEYVKGAPVTDWCDLQGLKVSERLTLFLQVLEAVQFAHERQTIHRDLKPSNILVTESGQVRLLDFGIAKLMEGEETDQPGLTGIYGRALTPDYASPEVLRGDPIDARSDLYSLGVLLYELLSGSRPYKLKSAASIGVLDQAIAAIEVEKPSIRLAPVAVSTRTGTVERSARELRGDLDSIVLKALAKDPAQRYQSAAAMADDLGRYLAGRPVQSRRGRISYRLGKFALRNRALLALSVAALCAILGAVIYARYRERLVQTAVATASTVTVSDRSIAVLPFVDMSEKQDQEYFGDGMAEEILDLLATIPGLRVIGRTSSFQFKGKNEDLRTIGAKLNAAYLLEGSVRKSGHGVRVTAQLINSRTGTQELSETYDQPIGDVIRLQDAIAAAVVRELQLTVAPGYLSSRASVKNADAYDLILRGRHAYDRYDREGLEEAVALFQQALDRDPTLADAALWLAWAYETQGEFGLAAPAVAFEQARGAASKALDLDPRSALAHTVLGEIHIVYDWDWAAAQREFQLATSLAPASVYTLEAQEELSIALGHLEDALRQIDAALAQDPLDPSVFHMLSNLQARRDHLPEAEVAMRRSLDIRPNYNTGHYRLGILLLESGDRDGALSQMQQEPLDSAKRRGLAMVYYALGRRAESDAELARMLNERAGDSAVAIADVYAFRRQPTEAMHWLERAYAQKDPGLYSVKFEPDLKNLEADPRYRAFLRKLNVAD
ncbi:MAG TPA: protein kinase [Steroidobacteraceae bacterium]